MKIKFKRFLSLVLCASLLATGVGCRNNGNNENPEQDKFIPPELRERDERDLNPSFTPDNLPHEEQLPKATEGAVTQSGNTVSMRSESYTLSFKGNGGMYILELTDGTESFVSYKPATIAVYTESSVQELKNEYSSVSITDYGCIATASIRRVGGAEFVLEDRYFYPDELGECAIGVRRTIKAVKSIEGELGFSTNYLFNSTSAKEESRFFIPHKYYDSDRLEGFYSAFNETELGLPMVAMMTGGGFTLSLGRYQPIINSEGNYTASLIAAESAGTPALSTIRVDYPSIYRENRYFDINSQKQITFDLVFTAGHSEDYNEMMVNTFNNHFVLQNQRIVDTDIDEVLKVICEDYKAFMLSTDKNGIVSYGLPWLVTIEDGDIGAKSYQSGFVGQQIPAAYQMLYYGVRYNDQKSIENGLNILNFWIDAGMMSEAGIPRIWYDGDYNEFRNYPTFLRMAVDTMEGYLDAYVLAKEEGIECDSWLNAITAFANFLVKDQNSDGSFYRCFDLEGEPYDDFGGQPEPENSIYKSTSKENTAMPVRFLADMYSLTGEERYKNAALSAAEYVYLKQYKRGYYIGGTCDNPNVIDKEAGVFAMYCYDAAYSLTMDEKWIEPMKQATAFVMSMVQCFSFSAGNSSMLKAAYGFKLGYNDGCSFITAGMNGLDNFAAAIYYHLFRLYAITGEEIYYYQAEFMQQNTKSLMDWDGALGYKYGSLLPEATTVCDFGFGSASDGRGVMGVWLPWQSVANASPICDMLEVFGEADVAKLAELSPEELCKLMFGE